MGGMRTPCIIFASPPERRATSTSGPRDRRSVSTEAEAHGAQRVAALLGSLGAPRGCGLDARRDEAKSKVGGDGGFLGFPWVYMGLHGFAGGSFGLHWFPGVSLLEFTIRFRIFNKVWAL